MRISSVWRLLEHCYLVVKLHIFDIFDVIYLILVELMVLLLREFLTAVQIVLAISLRLSYSLGNET